MTQQSDSARPGLLRRGWAAGARAWRLFETTVDRVSSPFGKIGKIVSVITAAAVVLGWVGYQIDILQKVRDYYALAIPCHKSVQPLWNLFKAKVAEAKAAHPKENDYAVWIIAFRENLMGNKICLQLPFSAHGKNSFLFESRADGMSFTVGVRKDELVKPVGVVEPLKEMRIEGMLVDYFIVVEEGPFFIVTNARITPAW